MSVHCYLVFYCHGVVNSAHCPCFDLISQSTSLFFSGLIDGTVRIRMLSVKIVDITDSFLVALSYANWYMLLFYVSFRQNFIIAFMRKCLVQSQISKTLNSTCISESGIYFSSYYAYISATFHWHQVKGLIKCFHHY